MVQCILTLSEVYTILLVNFICVTFVHIILSYFRRAKMKKTIVRQARTKRMRYVIIIFTSFLKFQF